MAGFDDTDELAPRDTAGQWRAVDGGIAAGLGPAEQPAAPQAPVGHPVRALFLVALGVLVLGGAVLGVWFAVATAAPASVPDLRGLTTFAASKALTHARLTDGRADYVVTHDFPSGLILTQSPAPGTEAARGSAVNVDVAVPPTQTVVPDVGLAEVSAAMNVLRYHLFQPAVLYAYNKVVATGLVIEQLPRAGDVAATGSSSVLVVSLGPGSGGESVPELVGQPLGVARSELTSQTLFALVRSVIAPGVTDGTVVDQAPSAGSVVPAASNVTLSIAVSRLTTR